MSDESKIERCPFCNYQNVCVLNIKTAAFSATDWCTKPLRDDLPAYMYRIACERCGAFGPLLPGKQQAISMWNDVSRDAWSEKRLTTRISELETRVDKIEHYGLGWHDDDPSAGPKGGKGP